MGRYDDLLADIPQDKNPGTYDDLLAEVDAPQPSLKDRIYKGANALFRPDSVMDGLDGTAASSPNPGAQQALSNIMSEQAAARPLQSGAKVVDGLGGVVEVGARKGYAGIGRVEAGVIQALADALGSDGLADIAGDQRAYANQVEQGAVLRGSPVEGFARESIVQDLPDAATNAIGSVIQTVPTLAAGAVAPEVVLPAIFATATAQEYGQGREAGLNPAGAALRAPIQGALEVVGEKLGGTERLAKALSAALSGRGPVANVGGAMLASYARELPAEIGTTTGQFLTDKLPGIGINQEAGLAEYGEAVKDTVLATLLQSGAMAAGGKAISRVADAAAPRATEPVQAPPADVTDALGALEKVKEFGEAQRAQTTNVPAQPRIEISQGDAESDAQDDAQAAENQARYEAEQANASELPSPTPPPVDRGGTGAQLDNDAGSAGTELLVQPAEPAIPTAPAASSEGDLSVPAADVADGAITADSPRRENEREGVRQQIEALIKRRAAANEMGKSRVFDNAMTAAKQLMSGEEVKPAKFKNAANTLAGDKTMQQALMALYDIAKQPGPEPAENGVGSTRESSIDVVFTPDQVEPSASKMQAKADFPKVPWQMTKKEWGIERERIRPNYAQSNFTKASASEATGNARRLEELMYGVRDVDSARIKAAQAEEIKLLPDEVEEITDRLNTPVSHEDVVKKAIAEGKQVPEAVLADYPELAVNEPMAEYAAYETDIFGNELPKPKRRAAATAPVPRNIHAAGAVSDTAAVAGEYFVNTVVGIEQERTLGASAINSAADAAAATQYLYKSAVERFDAIVTDKDGKPLAVVGGFKGALMQAAVYPAVIAAEAVRVPGAAKIWFSHNHPSGTHELSSADSNLYSQMHDVFRGSGIEPQGLLAVTGNKYSAQIDRHGLEIEQGDIPASRSQVKVPVASRELNDDRAERMAITGPDSARRLARDFYSSSEENGILLLDAQNAVVAWIPVSPILTGRLRDTGGLNSLYRAISQANAAAAIIVQDGSLDAELTGNVSVAENIGAALNRVDVKPLDIINVKTGESHAEQGRDTNRGPLFSRSAMKSVEANIQRGERAMNKALLDRADVNRAMYHNELGWIDFAWGDDSKGIQHIIRQRMNKDGLTSERIYQMLTTDLVETIAQGETIRRRDFEVSSQIVLEHNGHEAVLVRNKGGNGWLLTGWEVKASGAAKGGNDPKAATHHAADSTDSTAGAGVLSELSALARGGVNDADIRMSRADEGDSRGMRVEDVRAVLEPIEKAHPNLPGVIVVEKQADIPEIKARIDQALEQYRAESTSDNLVKLSQLLQDDIEGAYVDGKIYIVASNIADEQRLREVYAHEGIGHYSIEAMLNEVQPKLFDRMVARVSSLEKDGNDYIRKLARTVDRRQPGLDDATRAKEIIALIAERGDHETDMTPEIRSLWQRIADAIKAFAKLVFDAELTDRDVRDIVSMAARHAQGEATGSILAGGESVVYSRPDEPLLSRTEKESSKGNWLIRRDAAGRIQLAPTGKVYDVASAFIKKGAEAVNFAYAPPELRRMMRKMKADIQNATELAGGVAKGMKDMSDLDRRMVSDVIERMLKTGVTPPEHVLKVAVSMQQIMDVQTDDLVALGMLSGETAERWRGQYLPRFYVRDRDPALAELNPFIKAFRTAQPVRGLGGGSLKGRGLYEEIPVGDVDQWEALGWQVRDPLWKKNRQGVLELVDSNRVRPDADKVMVWRDFTPEERERMGENRDSLFRFVMGYTSMQKDIALGRLFDSIARNQEFTRSRPREGYTHVPDSVIPETGGVHRYGNLAGLYVRDDIMAHISQYDESSELLQGYRKALSFWKAGKTVLNPVAHMNNVISNLTMAHFAGVSYWDGKKYAFALRDLYSAWRAKKRGGEVPAMVKEAQEAGLFSGDLSREEFMSDMPDDIKAMLNQQDSKLKNTSRVAFNIATLWLSKPMGKAYRAEDDFFKYLIYRDARQNGMEPADAVDYATQYIFNYDDLPKSARVVRDAAIPFFSYTYKAVPALAHTAANYPWRFAAPAALIGGVNALAYALIAGDDDDDLTEKLAKGQSLEEQERKHLPPWMQGRSSLGTSKTVRLGTDERTGLPIYWDVSRFIPGGDLFDVTNQAEGLPLPAPIMPSNPVLTSVAALIWNKDTFTGKDITDKNDTPAEAAKKRGGWTLKMISPAIAPTGYHADRLMQATADGMGEPIETPFKDYTGFGKDGLPVQPKFAAMQTVGIKARPVDLETSADIARGQDVSEVRSIRGEVMQAKRLLNRGAISEREFERIREDGKEKIARIRAEE